jgi:hypothetical protein
VTGTPNDTSATSSPQRAIAAIAVRLGPMAAQALSASGTPRPERLERTLVQAIAYYVGPGRGTAGWAFPKFLVTDAEPTGAIAVQLERVAWEEIASEADRQGVEADALVQHAALFFGAARDAGQLTDRILADLERRPFGAADRAG